MNGRGTWILTTSFLALAFAACSSGPAPAPPPARFDDVLARPGPVDLRKVPAAPGVVRIRATVDGIDRKLNIVLLSAGADGGVREAQVFTVYRKDEFIAKVRIDRVEKDWSTGYSLNEQQRQPIHVGDVAVLRE